jgi:hypothetical protein
MTEGERVPADAASGSHGEGSLFFEIFTSGQFP